MRDAVNLQKFLREERNNIEFKGHCRIDYSDPITGKVLERIDGNNHVFTDQFMTTDFQSSLSCSLLITDGENELDTDLPWIPGRPIGYGYINSTATGIYQGAFRSSDSYRNLITQQGVTSLYVYDFLTTQIPDTIRYVGLTAANNVVSVTPTALFEYRWPKNDMAAGIYDIERKKLFHGFTCSLSNSAGGAGSLCFYELDNEPTKTSICHDVFALCGSPDNYYSGDNSGRAYEATWGYDYENQYVVLKLMRCARTYYDGTYSSYTFKDDFWVFNKDATEIVKHFTYEWDSEKNTNASWQYHYNKCWAGGYFSTYFRLYGDKAYFFSTVPPDYGTQSSTEYYVYQYDITTGDSSYEQMNTGHNGTHTLDSDGGILYLYKGYTFCQGSASKNKFNATAMSVNPMYDVYTDDVYTYCSVPISGSANLIEIGQTSIYGTTWNVKPSVTNTFTGRPSMPFALTAYQLPADAPARPDNSAVSIAYGLDIKW